MPLDGLVPSLAASGAIAKTPLTLIAGDLALDIFIVRGDDAFEIDENLAPVPGGASAPGNWKLYIQPPDHLNEEVTAAVDGSEHLAVGKPAAGQQQSASNESQPALAIDADALRRIGSAQ
ncbi:hypothetical protein FHT44_006201 [Mycolicibacterium sp. BK634]|uniref:hypothetical protein n=1 Tax=Mycolicibacterium sp. BK634 TaxID=2587099 RepID=UPI001616942A|nr:hypothetical protein [Mycolicibacterium sp. BK634]MBB3753679.1 hypothetical protein [Mycolicibacterium sp. BK634]